MKLRTERDGLLEAIGTAGRAASPRGAASFSSPSLQLRLRGDELEITGADPDLVITVRTVVAGEADGTVLVPARLVQDIVRSFDPGTVTIQAADEEVRLTSGRAEFTVREPVGAALSQLSAPTGEGISLPASVFAEGLRQVVRAALTDDSRAPQLTGVLMVSTETGLRLVATDSYRLAYRDLTGVSGLPPDSEVLVPARALAEVQRLVGSGSGSPTSLGFHYSDLDAVFDFESVRLTTRLLRGPFPDYQRLLPERYEHALTVGREELAAALRRVKLMVRDAKDAATPVRITFFPDAVELTIITSESGRATERVEGSFDGEEQTVAFNPTYLLDGVEAIHSEQLILEVIDNTKPATVRGVDDADYRYLLMPVRVS